MNDSSWYLLRFRATLRGERATPPPASAQGCHYRKISIVVQTEQESTGPPGGGADARQGQGRAGAATSPAQKISGATKTSRLRPCSIEIKQREPNPARPHPARLFPRRARARNDLRTFPWGDAHAPPDPLPGSPPAPRCPGSGPRPRRPAWSLGKTQPPGGRVLRDEDPPGPGDPLLLVPLGQGRQGPRRPAAGHPRHHPQ